MIYYLNFNLFIPYFWVFIYLQTVNQNKFWVLPLYTYIYYNFWVEESVENGEDIFCLWRRRMEESWNGRL